MDYNKECQECIEEIKNFFAELKKMKCPILWRCQTEIGDTTVTWEFSPDGITMLANAKACDSYDWLLPVLADFIVSFKSATDQYVTYLNTTIPTRNAIKSILKDTLEYAKDLLE